MDPEKDCQRIIANLKKKIDDLEKMIIVAAYFNQAARDIEEMQKELLFFKDSLAFMESPCPF